jgi:asparagine synthase (glutamine-hydrolysing)
MCGIAGIMSLDGPPVAINELRAMCAAMVHRGPDDEGYYLDSGVGLAMRRLSIIDLKTGRQPIGNEDGSVWVVLNGEIYNFRELRQELAGRGHSFSTATDTETIVHLYEEYGPHCVQRLRGMFGFALWDKTRRRLVLARDRLGIKPLYYADIGGRLTFASELKALLDRSDVERTLNWGSIGHLFTFLTTPRSESIIQGIHKLEPGQILIASPGQGFHTERYWDLNFVPDYGRTEAYFVERLRELLEESVRLHLVSDVPLGAFLSGGIDSSAVVATLAQRSTGRVKTFSIGFAEGDYNELDYARRVAKEFGTDHHELILEPDVLERIQDLAWYLDEPFGDSSAIPTYMVSKLASEQVTVVLSGDGGDELFAGYDKYRVEERERRYRFLPAPARGLVGAIGGALPEGMRGRNFLNHFSLTGMERYLDGSTLFRIDQKRRLFRADVFEALSNDPTWSREPEELAGTNGHWLSVLQSLDFKGYLPLDILTKLDRMSMAHSIEARVPLLDHKLVEFAASIPPELKLRNGTTKYIFKRALRGILPDTIIDRPKRGFAVPLGRWFRGQLGSFLRDLLLSDTARRRGIFNTDYIRRLITRHEQGRPLDLQLWTLISFELWCRTFLDRRPAKAVSSQGVENVVIASLHGAGPAS